MDNKSLNISLLLCSLLSLTSLHAQTDDLLASLSNDMTHFSEVATATKQNEHYQPYIISVFKGKDLKKLGVVNLEEALGLVPGVDMATDNIGIKTPIFRGSNPSAYGQSKLFIDGVPANSVFFDAYSEHLKMPIEMIKRIEVVRGPGSKTDGYNAYAGSINVITYAENFKGFDNANSIVIKGGSYKYGMVGFTQNYEIDNFSIATDFSYQQDDKTLDSGPDGYSSGFSLDYSGLNTALGRTGEVLMWSETYSLGLTLNYNNTFYAKLRILDHTQSSGYGINLYMTDDKKSRMKLPNNYIELGIVENIDNFDISIKGGMKYDAFNSDARLAPDGLTYFDVKKYKEFLTDSDPDTNATAVLQTPIVWSDGMFGVHSAEQVTYYQSSFISYSGIKNHNINVGYRVSQEKTIAMVSKLSSWATGDVDLVDYTDSYPFFEDNVKRDTVALFLEDSYSYSDSLSFLVGINYEKTSLSDPLYEPRASMVYQHNIHNIFKLLYSQSHRNPSWQEMFTQNNHSRIGSTEFEPERVEAYEAAYVHILNSTNHIQSNIFYLKNSDQIQIIDSSNGTFANTGKTTIYGLEFEYKGNISTRDSLYLNYSYIDGEENNREPLSNVAQHMFKGYYSYDITNQYSVSSVFKYVGEKERIVNNEETRTDPLRAYTKIDLTVRYDSNKYNYSLMASVKNIFDADIRFPSKSKTYIEDYIQEGRNFMITLEKEF